jgi:hypothetical protein
MGFGILDAFLDLGVDDKVLLGSTQLLRVVRGLFLELHMCGVELGFLIDVDCRHVFPDTKMSNSPSNNKVGGKERVSGKWWALEGDPVILYCRNMLPTTR